MMSVGAGVAALVSHGVTQNAPAALKGCATSVTYEEVRLTSFAKASELKKPDIAYRVSHVTMVSFTSRPLSTPTQRKAGSRPQRGSAASPLCAIRGHETTRVVGSAYRSRAKSAVTRRGGRKSGEWRPTSRRAKREAGNDTIVTRGSPAAFALARFGEPRRSSHGFPASGGGKGCATSLTCEEVRRRAGPSMTAGTLFLRLLLLRKRPVIFLDRLAEPFRHLIGS